MSTELDLDDVCAGNPLAERQLAELRAEVSTPVLVATNRLADALADARAEIAKLRDGMASDQERLKIYGDEISKLRAENARLKNLDMENIAQASKLEAEIAKLRAEREELRQALGLLVGAKDWTFNCVCEALDEEHLRTQVDYTERLWQRARAALAEKRD